MTWPFKIAWDQLFLPHEASAILGIPLSSRCPPDKITWLTPHWVCSPQAAPISSLFPVMLSVKQEARMWMLKNIFGREFGGYGFLTRLNILFGEVVMTLCQLWATSFTSRLRPLISVNFANSTQKIRCMPSGLARMLRVLGAQSNASTNRMPPNPLIFATNSLGFCRFRKITERRCLLYQFGSCEIGETLSILADQCTLRLISSHWRVTCCKISWLLKNWTRLAPSSCNNGALRS